MTLGIAVCLQDGAVLMSDSKEVNVYTNQFTGFIDKISLVTKTVGVIQFGTCEITSKAIAYLDSQSIEIASTAADILNAADKALLKAKDEFYSNHPEISKFDKTIRSALIFGGYLKQSNKPFICGINEERQEKYNPLEVLTIGGEAFHAANIFVTQVDLEQNFLRAGNNTIKRIELVDPTIGGRLQYAVFTIGSIPKISTFNNPL